LTSPSRQVKPPTLAQRHYGRRRELKIGHDRAFLLLSDVHDGLTTRDRGGELIDFSADLAENWVWVVGAMEEMDGSGTVGVRLREHSGRGWLGEGDAPAGRRAA